MNEETKTRKVEQIKAALVAGAHALYIKPIIVRKGARRDGTDSKINRLPLCSCIFLPNSKCLIIMELANRFQANIPLVARAVCELVTERKVYADCSNIDITDLRAVQDCLEEIHHKRGQVVSNVAVNTKAIIHLRDLKAPRPVYKGTANKPIGCPDWLLDVASQSDDPAAAVVRAGHSEFKQEMQQRQTAGKA